MSTIEQDPTITAEQPEEQPEAEAPTPVERPTFRFADVAELPDGTRVFVRLPNQFQHDSISEKARAAQARRMRQLRDPESDGYVVLEVELDDLQRAGDRDVLIDEIVGRDWWKDHLEAIKDVQEREEFTTIEADMERLDALTGKPEDERSAEEFAELERHVEAYNEAVKARREERQQPRRQAYADTDIADLISNVREARISAAGRAAFNRMFSMNEIALGTFNVEDHADGKPHPTNRYFDSVEAVEAGDPEVLEVLTRTFSSLERQFDRGAAGNA